MFSIIVLSKPKDKGVSNRFPKSYKSSPIFLLALALVLIMVAVFVIAPLLMRSGYLNETSHRAVSITIASNPSGPDFVSVDGANVTTPITETWSPGSIHQLEAFSPIPGSSGIRYAWAKWSDNGSQNQSYTVPDASQTVTATYTNQYEVAFSVNETEGAITPSGSDWYNATEVVPVSTIANAGYSFASWTGSGSISISNASSASTKATINGPGTMTANFASSTTQVSQPSTPAAPNVFITISSNPSGSGFIEVDGTMQVTPYSVSWPAGSSHTLTALSNVKNGTGVQYVWTSWSNGATQVNTYIVPSSSATITANYKTQYLLTVETNGLPPPYTTAVSVGTQQIGKANDATPITEWLDASSSTGTIGIDDTVIPGATGTQYVFTSWSPGGSTVNPRSSTTVTSPLTLTANYETQYQITFSANPSDGGLTTPIAGTSWYDASNQIPISAAPSSYKNLFALWTTTGNITVTSPTSSPTTATINGPGNITANFQSTIVYVTINAVPSNLPEIIVDGKYYPPSTITGLPFEWVMGTNHTIEAPSPYSMGTGTQYVFSSWSNGGPQTQNYFVPSSNATLTVTYNVQYELTVSGNYGTVYPANGTWYNAGASVKIYAVSPSVGTGERYAWNGWTGSGSGSYTGSLNDTALTMNAPINETASWTHQYMVTASYSTSDGSTPSSSVTLSGTQLGSSTYTLTLSKSAQATWLDAGTGWRVNNPITSGTQRWDAASGTSGNVTGPVTVAPLYYDQYQVTPYYTVSDSSSPTVTGVVGYTQFGSTVTATPTKGSSGGTAFWADAGSAVTYTSPISGASGERWQIASTDSGTHTAISSVSSPTTVTVEYYDQFQVTPYYTVSDSSSPTVTGVVGYTQFGSTVTATPTKGSSGGTAVWADAGSAVTYTSPIIAGTERWMVTSADTGTYTAISSISSPGSATVKYYDQYQMTLEYSIADSPAGSPTVTGIVSYTSFGSGDTATPALSPATTSKVWVDAGSAIKYTSPITSGSERWQVTSSDSGTYTAAGSVTGAATEDPSYYNQYQVTPYYTVSDSSSPTVTGVVGYTQFGSTATATPTKGSSGGTAIWADAGSAVTYTSPIAGGSGERWQVASSDSGTHTAIASVSSSATATVEYYHQYQITPYYTVSDSSSPTVTNVVAFTQFGGSASATPTKGSSGGTAFWVDAGSAVTYTSPIAGGSGERWQVASGDTTTHTVIASVSSSTSATVEYYHQFSVSFAYTANDGSTLKSQSNMVSYTQFGGTLHLSTNSAGALSLSSDWADAATSVTYVSPVTISGTERYMIASGDSGTHTVISSVASGASASPEYYHQYTITFGYGDQDTSVVTSGSQIGSYYQFGSSLPIEAGSSYGSTSPSSDWVNAGSNMVSYQTFASGGQRWALQSSPVAFTVSSSTTISETNFYHQYSVTPYYTVSDSSSPTVTGVVGYTQFGSTVTATPTKGSSGGTAIWADAGSAVKYVSPISGSGQRWQVTSADSGTYTTIPSVSSSTTATVEYYHQYQITPYYTVSDSSSPTVAGVVGYASFGSSKTATPTQGASGGTAVWVDAGSAVTYTSPINGASGERWQVASGDSGTHTAISSVSSSTSTSVEYYHQYQVSAKYSTSDGTTPSSSVTLSGTQFGSSNYQLTLTTAVQNVWLDTGTAWSVNNPITSGSEKWDATSGTSGTVSGAVTVAPSYYDQYQFTLSYSVTGGGTGYSAPTLTATQFGSSYTPTLSTTGTQYWLDAGSLWSVSNPLSGSSSSERWETSQTASGTVSSSSPTTAGNSLTFTYYNQYQVTFSQSGITSAAGSNTVLTVGSTNYAYNNLPSNLWVNSGSSFTWASPVSGGSGVRFVLSSNLGSSPISSSGAYSATYTTQYQLTFTESGLTSDAGSNTVLTIGSNTYNYSSFSGGSLTAWENSGATYTWSTTVAGLTNERFTTSTNTGTISSASSGDSASYTKQWYVTFTVSGLNSDATGTVLTVGSNTYTYGSFSGGSLSAWENYQAAYAWYHPVTTASPSTEQFAWVSGANGTVTSASSGDSATYQKQWKVTFTETGLNTSTPSVTVLTVNGTSVENSDFNYTRWVNSGDSLVCLYNSTVVISGSQFELTNVTVNLVPSVLFNPEQPLTNVTLTNITGPLIVNATYTDPQVLVSGDNGLVSPIAVLGTDAAIYTTQANDSSAEQSIFTSDSNLVSTPKAPKTETSTCTTQ